MEDFDKNPAVMVLLQKIVSFLAKVEDQKGTLDKICAALDEVTKMGDPISLAKIKGYRPTYNKEYTYAENVLATSIFPFLSEATIDPSTPIEALLSKKPSFLGLKPISHLQDWNHVSILSFSRRPIEMALRKFMFASDDDELSFLLKEPSDEFGADSPSSSTNKENPFVDGEPISSANPDQLVEILLNRRGL
nr:hypothetical protein [Tanacetum cinerariifolium]